MERLPQLTGEELQTQRATMRERYATHYQQTSPVHQATPHSENSDEDGSNNPVSPTAKDGGGEKDSPQALNQSSDWPLDE